MKKNENVAGQSVEGQSVEGQSEAVRAAQVPLLAESASKGREQGEEGSLS
jgi:hypothetical protein